MSIWTTMLLEQNNQLHTYRNVWQKHFTEMLLIDFLHMKELRPLMLRPAANVAYNL